MLLPSLQWEEEGLGGGRARSDLILSQSSCLLSEFTQTFPHEPQPLPLIQLFAKVVESLGLGKLLKEAMAISTTHVMWWRPFLLLGPGMIVAGISSVPWSCWAQNQGCRSRQH